MSYLMDQLKYTTIWQQDVNKSHTSQHNLISNNYLVRKGISIIALQELSIDNDSFTLALKDWVPVYPTHHRKPNINTRAVTLVRASLDPDRWEQIDFPSSDMVVIQTCGVWGKLTLINVYNDCNSNETIHLLTEFHSKHYAAIYQTNRGTAHVLWVGDFNRYHPYWDDPHNVRLFMNEATDATEKLIKAVVDAGLDLTLLSRILTHRHNVTKLWSRLDQVFITDHSDNILISCDTQPDHWGINTDHLPIQTKLDLDTVHIESEDIPNFQEADWESFQNELSAQLDKLPLLLPIKNQSQLNSSCKSLTKVIQCTINTKILVSTITPKSKHWWMKKLTQL